MIWILEKPLFSFQKQPAISYPFSKQKLSSTKADYFLIYIKNHFKEFELFLQDIQVYRYYRDLINFKTRGNPSMMLKCINPNEAKYLDPAAGIHIKFRLAGVSFRWKLSFSLNQFFEKLIMKI